MSEYRPLKHFEDLVANLPVFELTALVGEITYDDIKVWLRQSCWSPEAEIRARQAIAARQLHMKSSYEASL